MMLSGSLGTFSEVSCGIFIITLISL
jgi:hypothetical protein